MAPPESIKASHESSPLLSFPSSTSHTSYSSFSSPHTSPSFYSKELDLEQAMSKNTNERRSKPMVLLGSAGLALLLICLCAFSSNVEAASVARSLIGLESQANKLMPRAVTSSYAYQRMLANSTSPFISPVSIECSLLTCFALCLI